MADADDRRDRETSVKWLAISWGFVILALAVSFHACGTAHTCTPVFFYGSIGVAVAAAATAGVKAFGALQE